LDIRAPPYGGILYITAETRIVGDMKHTRLILYAALISALAGPALASDCYADYKAKQDNPLQLHYGVAEIQGDCSVENAASQLLARLGSDGWQLLNVLAVFDDGGLDQRKDSAGEYFLRY